MIRRVIEWSLQHPLAVLFMAGLLGLASLLSLKSLPVDAIPDLSEVQVVIRTPYAGQAPMVVEQQVTYPLSTALLAVPHAKTVRGYSFFGDSFVYVIFEEGTDPYWARSRVLEYLSQASAQLPSEVRPAIGPDASGVGWVYEYALVDRTGQQDLAQLTSLQNWFLKYELQTLPGVAEVATVGGMVRQYQVVLDPLRLRAHGLSLQQVAEAIRQGNAEAGGGVIEMAEAEYMVRASAYINSLEDLRSIPLISGQDGVPLLLEDVAEIRFGPQLRRGIAELDGQGEVVGGIIVMRHGGNARATIAAVRQRLQQLQGSLPAGVEIVTTYDRSNLIDKAIASLSKTLLEELLVVALICALFLFHLRSALVALISLPLGILAALLLMRWQGLNANIMSLGGIAIAIGAMVDGAIVMIENLHVHLSRRDQRSHRQIVLQAAQEVGPALFFSLAIITVSFLPVLSLQAQEGRLFTPLALTKTYAMAAAAILAISVVPVLMLLFIRGGVRPQHDNPINQLLLRLYRPLIRHSLAHPWRVLLLGAVIGLSAWYPASRLGSEFMPALDEGDWMFMPTTRPGISIGEARQLLQQTDKLIKSVPEVDTVFGKVGRADTATDPAPLSMIETTIRFKPPSEWRPGFSLEDIRAEIRQRVNIPGLSNAWVMPIKTRIDMLATGVKTPLGIKISGADLQQIQALGRDIENLLPQLQGTVSVFAERVAGGRYIDIDIDRQAAARLGVNVQQLQLVVRSAIGGMNLSHSVEGLERYPINMRYPQSWRNSPEALASLPIVTPAGLHIQLADVAKIQIKDGPPLIKSENGRLSAWVYVDIKGRDIGGYVEEAQALLTEKLELPPAYSLQWSGQYEYMQRAKQRLQWIVPGSLLLIGVLLYLAFNSLRQVLMILLTVPMALAGGFWLLYWQGYALSVAVIVGFIALAGVAVEIGVVLMTYLNQARQAQPEQDLQTLVQDTALRRLRPVVMTALATMAALVPVMSSDGTGAEVMQRIAAPMLGGMLSTLLLTLVVLPALYLLVFQRRS